jgi:hypothetical protein
LESFDFHHPGYCDICWDEIENSTRWDEEEEEWAEHDEFWSYIFDDEEDDRYDDEE